MKKLNKKLLKLPRKMVWAYMFDINTGDLNKASYEAPVKGNAVYIEQLGKTWFLDDPIVIGGRLWIWLPEEDDAYALYMMQWLMKCSARHISKHVFRNEE